MTNTIEIKDAPQEQTDKKETFKLSTTKVHRRAPKMKNSVLTGQWKPTTFSQTEFADFLTTYTFHEIVGEPTKKAIDKAKSKSPAFCMSTFKNNVRKKDHVEQVLGFVFDYDDGTTIAEFKTAAKDCGLFYVLYETFTSSTDKEKFRAVFPFSDAIQFKGTDWQSAHNGFAVQLGLPLTFDPTCYQPERLFFLPSKPVGEDAGRTFVNNGVCVDPLAVEPVAVARKDSSGKIIDADALEPLMMEVDGKEIDFRQHWDSVEWSIQLADILEEKQPDLIRKGRAWGGDVIWCPHDAEHSNTGDTSDTATFVDSPNGKHPATLECLHGCCEHRKTADHVFKLIEDGKLSFADVDLDRQVSDFIKERQSSWMEAEFYTKTEVLPSAIEMAELLNGDSSYSDIVGVYKALSVEPHKGQIERVWKVVKVQTGLSLASIKSDFKDVQKQQVEKQERAAREKFKADKERRLKASGVNIYDPYVYTPQPRELKKDYISFADQDADMTKDSPVQFPDLNTDGDVLSTLPNMIAYLNHVGLEVYLETFSGSPEIQNWLKPDIQIEQEDEHRNSLRVLMRKHGLGFVQDAFRSNINELANQNKRNILLELLNSYKLDGKPRLEKLWIDYFGADDTPLNRATAKCWMVAAVRRVRQPGVKFDTMPLLIGAQGNGKSTGIRILAGEKYYTENIDLGCTPKEMMEQAHRVWINEYAEMVSFTKKDDGLLKRSLSTAFDKGRLAYAELSTTIPRSHISIGTTNIKEILKDLTGNRRIWPISTGKVDLEALERDREQLIAEACYLEAQGESIFLAEELWSDAAKQQDEHMAKSDMFNRINEFLKGVPNNKNEIPVIHFETLNSIVGIENPAPHQSAEITLIMRKHNWIKCEVEAEGDTFQKVYWRQDHYTWKRKPKKMKYMPYSDTSAGFPI